MATSPPAYAWDWFARQRLLWREVRSRLAAGGGPSAARYATLEERGEVITLVRSDYPNDEQVRRTVQAVVTDLAFLGRTDRPFAALGVRTAPRGMRWWWTALTGEQLDRPSTAHPGNGPAATGTGGGASGRMGVPPQQLSLVDLDPAHARDDVAEGYGDSRR